MRRGEVYWIFLDPTVGGEIRKTRPGVVLSNDLANRVMNRIIVVPLTTNADHARDGEAIVSVNGRRQKALGSQIRTVSKLRLGDRLGELSSGDLYEVEQAVLLQLGIRLERVFL